MRLLSFVLLVALVTFLSSSTSASAAPANSDENVSLYESEPQFLGRALAVGNENSKRLLRTESKLVGDEDDEERAIMVKFKGSVAKLKAKFQKLMNWRYERMEKKGDDPDKLRRRYDIGNWGAHSRNKKLYNGFTAWYKEKHPGWVSKYDK
jgi:hypothetical protein